MRAHKYPPPNYTVAQYQTWPGDWELIDGYPYAMSPSASLPHQNIANEINVELRIQLKRLKDSCGRCVSVTDVDWVIDEHTVLRPDVVIVCDENGKFINKPPMLIVEIASPTTALKDRNIKYDIYEEQGVPYYIIIDPETKQYNIFVLNNGVYKEHNETTVFAIGVQCSVELQLDELLAEV